MNNGLIEFLLTGFMGSICLLLAFFSVETQVSFILITCGIMSIFALVLVYIDANIFYYLIIWTYFIMTEIVFEVNGGTFKLYFISSALIILIFLPNVGQLVNNKVFKPFFVLTIILFFSALVSDSINGAFNSSIFLFLNMMGAFAVFLVLNNKKITLDQFQKLVYWVLLINVCFGLIQILLYKVTGIAVGLGSSYIGQLKIQQISGFRYEANTHGKLVNFGILYCIPQLLDGLNKKNIRNY
jgi:hypothetical protein